MAKPSSTSKPAAVQGGKVTSTSPGKGLAVHGQPTRGGVGKSS
jgi:hypothetical protein